MKINEKLPIILQKVCAGFPSPATDYLEDEINLNEELISNKASTFLIRVSGIRWCKRISMTAMF
jgi:DNA polymerase V